MIEGYTGNVVEAQFSLIICGKKLDLEDISEQLGMEPTRVIHTGEVLNRLPQIIAQDDAWYHTIQLSAPEGRDPALLGYLGTLVSAKDKLKAMIEAGNQVKLKLYVNSNKAVMGYQLMPMTLDLITKIGLPLDVTSVSWGDVGI